VIGLKTGMTMLNAGCGRGYYAGMAASRAGPDGHVIALDRQEELPAWMRQEMGPPSHTNLSALRADLYQGIPLGNRSVDVCLMVNVLHGLYADKKLGGVITEVKRVLRDGGLWAVVDIRKDAAVEYPSVAIRLAPDQLHELVKSSGFVLKEVVYLNQYYQLVALQALPTVYKK
jgi:ubiquinone/menaquinone biosynthesis C-methylase UbiE